MNAKDKLSTEDQQSILFDLFGFNLTNEGEDGESHFVLYDEDGYEFYGSDLNCKFDFTTIKGIIEYATTIAREQGSVDKQWEIRRALGLF